MKPEKQQMDSEYRRIVGVFDDKEKPERFAKKYYIEGVQSIEILGFEMNEVSQVTKRELKEHTQENIRLFKGFMKLATDSKEMGRLFGE